MNNETPEAALRSRIADLVAVTAPVSSSQT